MDDLELLHHWTVFAAKGFGDRPGDEKSWQVDVPQMAVSHPYLMRGILAVSALHMARVRATRKDYYLVLAAYHQGLALPYYRQIMGDIKESLNQENCHVIISFASLTCVYAFAYPQSPGSALPVGVTASAGVPHWLNILRGARQITTVAEKWIANGPMTYQVRRIRWKVDVSCNPDDGKLAALESLLDRGSDIATSPNGEEEMQAYRMTLQLLRESFAMPYLPSQTLGVKLSLFLWVESMPQLFLELLSELRPEALILFAHSCVMMKKMSQYWYIEGVAESILSAIKATLDDHWRPWIAWPLREIPV
ncbi:hypothetical protein MMC09_005435 [Bachmanniomyces sp. S44760]|nr:hypothetical protein [Bachmanniomyces sp. S44760]